MPGPSPPPLLLSPRQRSCLERLVRRHQCPQSLLRRAQIVLMAGEGHSNAQIARRLRLAPNTVALWRSRWSSAASRIEAWETDGEKPLAEAIEAALTDELRPGVPATFTPEQVAGILAVSLEDPQSCGIPLSHWTPPELAKEVTRRGIVERISSRSVGRFLKGGRSQASPQPVLAEPGGRGPGSL